jgi:hypothetical protein
MSIRYVHINLAINVVPTKTISGRTLNSLVIVTHPIVIPK